ncbi:hypothetical protein FHY55_19395 [Oceanicola sp. D3]|uniref:hypothetical protein n=1 Tax=Oceanicola sp. D3 TaxID=2587163 RepID=UPI00111EC4D7|nr:hypothetical protein [Oceanicola sp. D3]QDC11264.1 hypothetical protein FHY55_19395 [Oceanicola sp. D3]
MTALRAISPIDIDLLEEYPLDPAARLDSHGFVQWEFRRWLSSDLRWQGTHECKSMWFELVNLAHGETPVGTLPQNTERLARMIVPAVDRGTFEQLCTLEFGPLHGWRPCRCGDDIRLMHPVVTRIVLAAFASRANHNARVEAASEARRLKRLTEDITQLSPQIAEDPRKVRWISSYIEDRINERGGTRRTAEELHTALSACVAEIRAGRFPEKTKA